MIPIFKVPTDSWENRVHTQIKMKGNVKDVFYLRRSDMKEIGVKWGSWCFNSQCRFEMDLEVWRGLNQEPWSMEPDGDKVEMFISYLQS